MNKFIKIDLADRLLNTFQDNVATTLNEITPKSILDGQIIEAQLESGINVVNHKLGRNYIGWFLVKVDSASTISHNAGEEEDKYIFVNASSDVKAWIWVF